MIEFTLCYPVEYDSRQVLLGQRKIEGLIGKKICGFGGHVERSDPTILDAALRELQEEAGISAQLSGISKVGELYISHQSKEGLLVHIFIVNSWTGQPEETDEMKPIWFSLDALPLSGMPQNDALWVERILNGEKLRISLVFDENTALQNALIETGEFA
jgi:8-oxo-dGTP pyrophosphatase MutT (NUDIX family)